MKIQAKDIKNGQTVKHGNVWVVVENIGNRTRKNGKPYLYITGTGMAGVVKRRGGWYGNDHYPAVKDYGFQVGTETWVNIK